MNRSIWWLLIALLIVDGVVGVWWWCRMRESRVQAIIIAAAERYRVDPALVKAVVWRESRFDPDARGAAGEIGLMQIRELAAREWAEAERIQRFHQQALANARTNMLAGTWYLAKLLNRYRNTDNPLPYALADYNAGRNNVLRWNKGAASTNSSTFMKQIDFPGTRGYVESVLNRRRFYQSARLPRG